MYLGNVFDDECPGISLYSQFSCGRFVVVSSVAIGIADRNLPKLDFIEPNLALGSSANHLAADPGVTGYGVSESCLQHLTAYLAWSMCPGADCFALWNPRLAHL